MKLAAIMTGGIETITPHASLAEAARSPPELRVVRGARATAKPAGRGAAKPAAKRKRA